MRRPAQPKTISFWVGALVSIGLLVTTAPALGDAAYPGGASCRADRCEARLRVGSDETKWRSIETFYPNNERIVAALKAKGRRLELVEAWGPKRCRRAYHGAGIVAVVKACGEATPLRVRAYRIKRKRIKLYVGYRAEQVLYTEDPPASG